MITIQQISLYLLPPQSDWSGMDAPSSHPRSYNANANLNGGEGVGVAVSMEGPGSSAEDLSKALECVR